MVLVSYRYIIGLGNNNKFYNIQENNKYGF